MKMVPIVGWSPTKLFAYEECPLRAQLQYAQKLCPLCFRGHTQGGFDGVAENCTSCHQMIVKAEALTRGIRIGLNLERFILGLDKTLDPDIKNKDVIKIAKQLRREAHKPGKVRPEYQVTLDKTWHPIDKYTKNAWFRGKLDVLRFLSPGEVQVLDWKTGGIGKDGQIRENDKYDDQLHIYGVAALCALSEVNVASAALIFVDAPPEIGPVLKRDGSGVTREDLESAQRKWEHRVSAMFRDQTFAPRPGFYCRWCPYSKEKEGPCPVA